MSFTGRAIGRRLLHEQTRYVCNGSRHLIRPTMVLDLLHDGYKSTSICSSIPYYLRPTTTSQFIFYLIHIHPCTYPQTCSSRPFLLPSSQLLQQFLQPQSLITQEVSLLQDNLALRTLERAVDLIKLAVWDLERDVCLPERATLDLFQCLF